MFAPIWHTQLESIFMKTISPVGKQVVKAAIAAIIHNGFILGSQVAKNSLSKIINDTLMQADEENPAIYTDEERKAILAEIRSHFLEIVKSGEYELVKSVYYAIKVGMGEDFMKDHPLTQPEIVVIIEKGFVDTIGNAVLYGAISNNLTPEIIDLCISAIENRKDKYPNPQADANIIFGGLMSHVRPISFEQLVGYYKKAVKKITGPEIRNIPGIIIDDITLLDEYDRDPKLEAELLGNLFWKSDDIALSKYVKRFNTKLASDTLDTLLLFGFPKTLTAFAGKEAKLDNDQLNALIGLASGESEIDNVLQIDWQHALEAYIESGLGFNLDEQQKARINAIDSNLIPQYYSNTSTPKQSITSAPTL